jgi:hypothetical protein
MKWKDVSSYCQGDVDCTPRTWSVDAGAVTIIITRWLFGNPDRWYLSCAQCNLNRVELNNLDIEPAKKEAVELVRSYLQTMLAAVDRIAAIT